MTPFVMYILFGLVVAYATAITTYVAKRPVKLDEVLVAGFFWPFTTVSTITFLIKQSKENEE